MVLPATGPNFFLLGFGKTIKTNRYLSISPYIHLREHTTANNTALLMRRDLSRLDAPAIPPGVSQIDESSNSKK